ncbi:c-type cytochrome [Isosphaeraceae bacterium EP7]
MTTAQICSRPRGRRLGSSMILSLLCLTSGATAALGQGPTPPAAPRVGGLTPEQARAKMTLAQGISAGVFASEPMVRQPVAACFDERGRMWVIEYLQYPNPAGLKPVKVDQFLRTEYDRVPEPPPKGPRGADRIKILEDTDGDGVADKSTVFLEGLNLATGIAVGRGGVFIGQAPYLLFYPDKDRDDRPDGDPEVLLSGFGLQDAHATLNSLTWGPDGWLYGAQGSTVTAKIRGIEFQQGIWRYQVESKRFELFAEGGGNTYGLDFDRTGNLFGSSNGGFIAFHMVQGGYYWKGFAKHGPLHNPNTFGYFDAIRYVGTKVGGHVTPGGIIYKGGAFPAEFDGAFIGGNLLANAVYWHTLTQDGSTFAGKFAGTLLDSHDPWFRPVDHLVGPDGAVYVVDWHDKRASHLDPRDNWDRSNGRIFRITHGAGKATAPFDLAAKSTAELVALRTSRNDWYAAEARRILADRRDPGAIPALKALLADDRDETLACRDLWMLNICGALDDAYAESVLSHPVAAVRRWTVRLLGDDRRMNATLRGKLLALASDDPDATVRSQLAASCQRWDTADALPILGRLASRSEDAGDRFIPMQLWWALERHLGDHADDVVGLMADRDVQGSPIVREILLERLARALGSRGTEADFSRWTRLLEAAPSRDQVDRLIAGLEKGLEGRKIDEVPPALAHSMRTLAAADTPSVAQLRLAIRLGVDDAYARAVVLAGERGTPEVDRIALIEILGQRPEPAGEVALLKLIGSDQAQAPRTAAVAALGGYDRPAIADALVALVPGLPAAIRDRVVDVLCSRKSWAGTLVGAIEAGKIPVKDIRAAQVIKIAQLSDPALTSRLEGVWGRVPTSNSAEKARRIAEVRGMLPEGDKGDPKRGVLVFREHCATCHLLHGEGTAIGPDLTGAERGDLDFLLTSLVAPGAVIRKEYQAQTVAIDDGRVLTGLIVEESPAAITLLDANRQKTVIPRDGIEELKLSETSLMPEGILDKLNEGQVRDLFRYLQSSPPAR